MEALELLSEDDYLLFLLFSALILAHRSLAFLESFARTAADMTLFRACCVHRHSNDRHRIPFSPRRS